MVQTRLTYYALQEGVCILYKKMAKQTGPLFITGTIDKVCFYKLDENYYARSKSNLSGVRVKKDPAFAKTMANAALLKEASALASLVYRNLDSKKRKHALYRQMTGAAMHWLKEGKSVAEVKIKVEDLCGLDSWKL